MSTPLRHGVTVTPLQGEDSFNIFCGGVFLSHFSCFFFRKRRNKRNQTEREKRRKAAVGLVSLRLGHATALTPHCGVIHYRGAVSLRSRELLSKLKIPPLATDCFPSPSANPTVPDLLVSLGGGRWSFAHYSPWVLRRLLVSSGHLLADSRKESGGRS